MTFRTNIYSLLTEAIQPCRVSQTQRFSHLSKRHTHELLQPSLLSTAAMHSATHGGNIVHANSHFVALMIATEHSPA